MSSPPPPPQLLHVDKLTTKLGPSKRKGGKERPLLPPSLPPSAASVPTFHLDFERTLR